MAEKQHRVVVYSTPTCPYCRSAKRYLQQKGIRFRDVDVSRDAAAAREMVRRSGQQGVPVLDIDGKIVVGFNRPKIDQLLGLS
jgi:glutaredoxin-like YruB-family protein